MERDAILPSRSSRTSRFAEAAAREPLRALVAQRKRADLTVLLGVTAFLLVGGLAFANGGYFPVAQGWAALILLWLGAAALATRSHVMISRPAWIFVATLAAFTAWTFVSALWSVSVTETFAEGQRLLLYVVLVAAALLLVERASDMSLATGIWAAIALIATYSLATRLFPKELTRFDSVAVYRLSAPVGYWNALGLLAGMGAVLAVGLAARSHPALRALAGASVVLALTTMYFTFSRGSWIAVLAGFAVAVGLDRRRLQLVSVALGLAPWAAVAVWYASRSKALTHQNASASAAATDGHAVAVIVIGAASGAALTMLVLEVLDDRVTFSKPLRRIYALALVVALATSLTVTFAHYGSPVTLARKAYRAFNNERPPNAQNLNARLLNLSGNGRRDQWRVAYHEAKAHPLAGSGAGTYDIYWFQKRRQQYTVKDAHNLYLETFAEVGAIGLALLLVALLVPLAAAWRARGRPLGAVLAGAYVAYLLHAGADWDWELPVVTTAALLCACGLLSGVGELRTRRLLLPARAAALMLTLAVTVFVVVALIGNSALSASTSALAARNYAAAEHDARRAMSFLPWSSGPWKSLGDAQAQTRNYAAARQSFLQATAKDMSNWLLWLDLAQVSRGNAADSALRKAVLLNPLSPEIVRWEQQRRLSASQSH